ncbi:sensor domain-containing diguanylate cyclase [Pseudomonas sp. M47T1]|uniref:sensor domain-containing diguanylate cyclase n=1 Tax=Pseudomonas sp. M47T1 TaxID=1179778 RepID=UPI0012FBC38F|nr:sensor domain-containing diguanylate cyclase [Pseudomonas sp. M47T1]
MRLLHLHLRPPPRAPQRYLVTGCGLTILAIIAIVTFLLARERTSAERDAARAANNIVQLISIDVQRNVDLYDRSLVGLIEASQHPDFLSMPPSLRQRMLFDGAVTGPFRGDILWLGPGGDILADSRALPPRKANFSDRPNFQYLRSHPQAGLEISEPFRDRIGDLGWCISFSRRISSPSGEFLGVASGALQLGYFSELFKSLTIGKDSSVNLISEQGIFLAREPELPGQDLTGQDFSQHPNFKRVVHETNGSFVSISSVDRKQRLYTFAKVGPLPMIVIIALSTDEVYASWRRTAVFVGTATALLCMALLWLCLMMSRELHRRVSTERELTTLASTDSLTGLANRRSLDRTLRTEWARSQRNGKPLSLLMIDVDHFKAFNERHGHPGGDEALRCVAKVINACIHRPADLAARYGGEEFMVVLAETDLNGALIIAETIRNAIEGLPPFGDDRHPVTVSIGVGTSTTRSGLKLDDLLAAADVALYQAKDSGRNQVGFHDKPAVSAAQ